MKTLLILLLPVFLLSCLVGCYNKSTDPIILLEYPGVPLSSIEYRTVDYMGGASVTYNIDFVSNTTTVTRRIPDFSEDAEDYFRTETEVVGSFTDEDERLFINRIYSFGFFSIKDRYEPMFPVMDGGGWDLVVEYDNGQQKRSSGSNAAPGSIFANCAIPFYLLTGVDVLGRVPSSYIYPPNISYSVDYSYANHHYSGNAQINVKRADYLWNDHRQSGSDLYQLNCGENDVDSSLLLSGEYKLAVYTSNYHGYDRFIHCEIKNYDLDPTLSGEKIVYSSGWFKNESIPLELNKIYLVTLSFLNGDYVQYTFHTAAADRKINYGKYSYNVFNQGKCELTIDEDGSFTLNPFSYIDKNFNDPDASKEPLVGSWNFEYIDGVEHLVLTANSGERLVFNFSAVGIYLDIEKTTLDLKKYNLDGDNEYYHGNIEFNIY